MKTVAETKKSESFVSKLKRIFDIRLFPMDLARFFLLSLPLFFRGKKVNIKGEKYRPDYHGGAIFAPNHTSFSDPIAIVSTFWYRRVFFLASEAAMSGAVKTVLFKGLGCIRVDRNISDIEAIHKVRNMLSDGRLVTVFPQGHIERESSKLGKLKSGAVLMALQSGVPIIPMYSVKRRHFYERRLFVIGDAIDPREYIKGRFPSMENIETVTAVLEEKMEECRAVFRKMKGYE